MKKLLVLALIIASSNVFGQKILKKLTYKDSQEYSVFKKIKNRTSILEYIAADGSVLKVGDTLVMGKPDGTESRTVALGVGNELFGAVANSKTEKNFVNIVMGKRSLPTGALAQMTEDNNERASANKQNEKVIIKQMRVFHKGSKKKPLLLNIVIGDLNGRAFGLYKYMSIMDYEKAVITGEIKSLNAPMTREEAIAKLKEAKELLELGLMEKSDFEKLKTELAKIIMKR